MIDLDYLTGFVLVFIQCSKTVVVLQYVLRILKKWAVFLHLQSSLSVRIFHHFRNFYFESQLCMCEYLY